MAWIRCTGNTGGSLKVRTASGAIASFETNLAEPLQSVKCEINASGGNGTPDNPNPINGYTEANITNRTGVNIWDEQWEIVGGRLTSKNYIKVLPSTQYFFYNINLYDVTMYDSNYTNLGHPSYGSRPNGYVFNTAATCAWIKFDLGSPYGSTYHNDVSINYPATDMDYHPYNGNTVTISFGQTVYGGVLDVTRGKLSVKFLEFDLGILTPVMYVVTEGNLFRYALDDLEPLTSDYDVTKIICSNYPSVASASRANKTLSQVSNLLRFDIIDNDYNDAASMKTAMNGVEVAYPLETPFDIDLTPEVISALALPENNNVFADTGDIEVKYLERE